MQGAGIRRPERAGPRDCLCLVGRPCARELGLLAPCFRRCFLPWHRSVVHDGPSQVDSYLRYHRCTVIDMQQHMLASKGAPTDACERLCFCKRAWARLLLSLCTCIAGGADVDGVREELRRSLVATMMARGPRRSSHGTAPFRLSGGICRSAQAGNTLLIMLQTATPDFKARGVSALGGSARQPASRNHFRLGGGSARIDPSVPLRAHECVASAAVLFAYSLSAGGV